MAEIEYLEINDITRMINVPKNLVLGVMGDKNVKRVYFKCKRIVGDNVDLSKHQIYIKYVNALDRTGERLEINEPGIYHCEDVSNQGDYITFSWLLSENVFKSRGFVAFSINATDGERTRWNTFPAIGTVLITITGGLQEVQERYPDIITQLLNRMDEVEKLTTPETMQKYVNAYLAEHKIETNPYIGKTIVAFGDSIIAGWGWKEGTGIITPLKERYNGATWINNAESGSNMAVTSNPSHTPIVTKIASYTGAADAIIFDGGVNDKNNGISIGSITAGYDATYDTRTFCGSLESSLQYIMDRYPLAVKLYLIPHSFGKDNSYLDSIYEKAIEICDKWNMPYLDMRKCSQIAMTSKNKSKYTYNQNSKKGDGVHPNETWYRTFYCPVIDQVLQYQGIGSITASKAPEVVAVTGVKLDQTTLTLNAGESAQLTATVSPSNATNKLVTWGSNNSNVSVSGGKVTAKTAGSAIVTVTTADGGYTAQCNVTVNASTEVGHTELASLSLDGNCYFDTEILPDQNTNTEAKLYVKSGTTYICGAMDDKYKYGYTTTDNFYAVRGSVSSAAKNAVFWEDAWTIKQNGATATFGNNSVTLDNAGNFTLTSPYYIGCMSKNGEAAGTGLKGKIYYAKIYSGDTLVADMIPVKKSDGTLCLYDKARKKYIYNAGTGTLTE